MDIQTELDNNTDAIKLAQDEHAKAHEDYRELDIPATWDIQPQAAVTAAAPKSNKLDVTKALVEPLTGNTLAMERTQRNR